MSATGVSLGLLRELRAICGETYVAESEPADVITVSPASADEVVAVLGMANAHRFSVTLVGGGSEFVPSATLAKVLLHTGRLTEVEHYDPADLTVGVGAGMTVAQLKALVGADQLIFACDPSLPEQATIGGILASAAQGPTRHGYGALRDFCIGIRFVTGDGRKAKGGGRVVKNVAGYDLMKLLIGSCGTLAIITSASFKLFPTPRQTRTFLAEFFTWQEALKFRDLILQSPLAPMCLELVSPRARKMMRLEMIEDAWVICVRASGSDAVLARYRKELGAAVTREVVGDDEIGMWSAIADFPVTKPMKSDPNWPFVLRFVERFSITVPPAELGSVLEAAERISNADEITFAYVGRVGLGHVSLTVDHLHLEAPDMMHYLISGNLPHSFQVHKNALATGRIPPDALAAMRAVKRALDPNNILRGRELF